MAMSSGLYANMLIRALTAGADSVNLTTFGTIQGVIIGTTIGSDISANYASTTTNVVSYAAEAGAGTKGWVELATGHGYTQSSSTSGFAASAFTTTGSTGSWKLQWPAASENIVWTATDSTGIVQPTNSGIVLYWKASPYPLIALDYITAANSATGNGATYTATWASGVFTIQVV